LLALIFVVTCWWYPYFVPGKKFYPPWWHSQKYILLQLERTRCSVKFVSQRFWLAWLLCDRIFDWWRYIKPCSFRWSKEYSGTVPVVYCVLELLLILFIFRVFFVLLKTHYFYFRTSPTIISFRLIFAHSVLIGLILSSSNFLSAGR